MSGLLNEAILQHIGTRSAPKTELVTRRDIRKYAIATEQRQRKYLDGDEAPPMFYLALFWDVVEREQLSPDGVFIDTLLPKLPLERAMAGGLKIDYYKPMLPGDTMTATRTLTDIYEKEGSQGPLIFYEVNMEVVDAANDRVLTEKTTRIMR